ncbi:hypothetical protein CFN78_20110 [Amycolatopsis antarctica]|uniref:DUF5753 domain-containing protein n=1 Tax=Amycolatopsis antarctica TaxID=1854586 RepID=A0A263CZ55_9PSEU|nr:DUF5753 domain-containing protein [Amycolatopsis antarctica]OZM71454.1 hypothetical protein CFN78_20110 [Amycolatopsis antarctica]
MALEKTRRKVKLGRYMLALRKAVDPPLRPEDIAPHVRIAATTITRMEGGLTQPGFTLLQALLGIYGVTEEQRTEAIRLWENAKQGSTSVEHAADLPNKYRAFRHDEADAALERTLEMTAIPGLLQTPRYAAAVGEASRRLHRTEGWERRAADERHSRQRLLDGEAPLHLHALIDEALIRRITGGREVMIEQLEHLLKVGRQRNVTIQVIPFSAGAYGNMSGPVTILSFPDGADPDLAYLEYAAGGETVENVRDVQAFVDTFEDASRHAALSATSSTRLIRAALDELRNDERAADLA